MINSNPTQPSDELFYDLVIEESLMGLSNDDQQRLDEMLETNVAQQEADEIRMTIAALDLAFDEGKVEKMPASFREKLQSDGASRVSNTDSSPTFDTSAWTSSWNSLLAPIAYVLVGSVIGLAISSMWTASPNMSEPTVAQQLENFRDSGITDLQKVSWQQKDDTGGENVTGEVVWSDSQNEGYMVFDGLKTNDPGDVYQLWIFDADRPETDIEPVNGGVFKIASDGKAIVPIDFTIKTSRVKLFALTVEKDPGVAVSKRERLPVLAPVEL